MRIIRKAAAAAIVTGLLAGAAACGGSTPPAHPAASGRAVTPAAKCWPCTSAPATTAPAAPKLTTAQQQALDSAKSYLSDGQGFSRRGLLDQLTSSYGEGFSRRLATWALAHIRVNWNKQAVISAKGYLRDGQGFSYSGLVQQLESPYGNQFTPAQARYGARAAMRGM
jgi:hypothetical protein